MKINKAYKKLGYGKDREGLIRRFFNESKNWEAHLQNTKNYILESAQNKCKGTAVIMGSGWWLDLPVDELSQMFEQLIFTDITHPRQIEKKAERYPNIKMVSGDVTGALEKIYRLIKRQKAQSRKEAIIEIIRQSNALESLGIAGADYYVSVNLLSQLGVFPAEYIKKKCKLPDNEIQEIVGELQNQHLQLLPKEKTCMISDYKEICLDKTSHQRINKSLIHCPLPEGSNRKEWLWDFDLSGNYKNCKKASLSVFALNY
jgi:hypothetical protein